MDENNSVTPRECRGAKEYAKRRLRESDEPMSPKELADEYDCSGSHMRSQVSDLKQNGEIESVTYGYYDVTDDDATQPDDDNRQQTLETMPTQKEYNRQYNDQTDGTTDDIADNITVTPADRIDGDGMQNNAKAPDESVTPAPLPAEPKQLLVVLAALIGLYLLYQNLDSGNETSTPSESESNTAEDTTGGLIQ